MIIQTEILDQSQKVLLVAHNETHFLSLLKKQLSSMQLELTVLTALPDDLDKYDAVFFIQIPEVILPSLKELTSTKFVFIFFDDHQTAQIFSTYCYEHHLEHIKVLNLQTYPEYYQKDIETILWFAFSRSFDIFLHIYHQPVTIGKRTQKKKKRKSFNLKAMLTPKRMILIGILCIILTQFLFLPALMISTFAHYRAYKAYEQSNTKQLEEMLATGQSHLRTARSLFSFSRPALHFFSIALPFEDLLELNESLSVLLYEVPKLQQNAAFLSDSLLLKDKSEAEILKAHEAKDALSTSIDKIHGKLPILKAKLPGWTEELQQARLRLDQAEEAVSMYQEIDPFVDSILARDTSKKYLLLFANNMELRPGGGFIGSFAIVDVSNYTIQDIRVYDVYDADGQLTTRVEPPMPISEYLEQPFWYLRDSAFSGDFTENARMAEYFLELEMNESEFDGVILVTTTAVKNILSAFDSLYISDYKETITGDNFYLKAQLYAESDFFPGSLQKKSFLSSVMDSMMIGLAEAAPQKLISEIMDSLNQKQMVVQSKDASFQMYIEDKFWSGTMLKPECTVTNTKTCIPDYLYALDANLGVNKANFFIQRPTSLKVSIDTSGRMINTLTTRYKNDSHEGVFPGGTYKNYIQLYLPPNAIVQSVQIDGSPIQEVTETNFEYKTLGFYVEIEPQQQREIVVRYTLPTTIVQGDGIYQLIVQKQVGSPNYDFVFEFDVPENMTITRHNLSPLAQDAKILYNTSVSSDKIFLIEYSKN